MSKRKIGLIIGVISVAMLGLVGFQAYWVSNAFELRNEQFNLKVADALQEVVRKLEKQEIIYLIQQRDQIEQQQRKLEALQKSRLVKREKSAPRRLPEEYVKTSRKPTLENVPSSDAEHSDALRPRTRPMTDFQSSLINDFLSRRANELPQIERFLRLHQAQERLFDEWFNQVYLDLDRTDSMAVSSVLPVKTTFKRLKTKTQQSAPVSTTSTDMLRGVFKDLMFSKRAVEQRVSRLMLDSLLKTAFQERGIELGYEFALQNVGHANVIFSTLAFEVPARKADLYKATLFPNEINNVPSQLLVYFPQREDKLWQNMTLPLASTGLMIAVILGCFYVAVSTIVRQKKMADVKNDFVNNMTHEFKTPISTINLAVAMAQEQVAVDSTKISRYLQIIQDENQRLSGHVEKVLQMALLERGEIRLKKTSIHLHDLLEQVLNSFSVQMEQRQAEVDLQFEADPDVVEADQAHLSNVFSNLVDNALKYSLGAPHLTISTQTTTDALLVVVSDRGIGMNAEQQAKIFEAFYRVPTGNVHDVKGFGLGLSYVKKMVEAHGGTIEVKSKSGEGSSFVVTLPLATAAQ